ncbi:MAG: hypothetical protein V3W14_13000 [Candidatus Neomarinimicrobiota bacterium]
MRPLPAAFEGAELFRATLIICDGIYPPAFNSPARLPASRLWASFGRGVPFGRSWAAGQQGSIGGSIRSWRGALSGWNSGDRLYRETSITTAMSRKLLSDIHLGLSLTYNQVSIEDFDPPQSELLFGFGLAGSLTRESIFSVWYSGLAPNDSRAYESLARQLFQVALLHPGQDGIGWALGLEKTPEFKLRQSVELSFKTGKWLDLLLGYRTQPSMPVAGAQLSVARLQLHFRVIHHPVLGISTAFGLAIK